MDDVVLQGGLQVRPAEGLLETLRDERRTQAQVLGATCKGGDAEHAVGSELNADDGHHEHAPVASRQALYSTVQANASSGL